jgi:tetratricopeptide (TPR) repeat protein
MGKIHESQVNSSKALKWIDKVTERERYYIEAEYYRYRNQYQKAIENYKILTRLYPDDFTGYSNLAFIYQFTREYEKALIPLKEAARISPKSWYIYQNLGLNYGGLGKMELARKNFLAAVEMNPNQNWSYLGLSMINLVQEDFDQSLSQVNKFFTSGDMWASIGYEWRASCYKYFGKFDKAVEQLDNGIKIDQRSNDKSREASKVAAIAEIYKLKDDNSTYTNSTYTNKLKTAVKMWPNSTNNMKLGIAYARNKQFAEALEMAKKIENEIIRNKATTIVAEYNRLMGQIELSRGLYHEAINFFETSKSHEKNLETILSLGLAYEGNGNLDKAIQEYQYISSHKWATLFDGLTYLWPISQYHLANAYEQKGEAEKAKEHFQSFLDLWRNADPDIELLKRIKKVK